MPISPRILVISSDNDFATDLITIRLAELETPYLRLNLEDLNRDQMVWNADDGTLFIQADKATYLVHQKGVRSVYFRGPTAVRSYTREDIAPVRLNQRNLGWAFLRSFAWSIERSGWMDHPSTVYEAEHKLLQLKVAQKCGFRVPRTEIVNEFRNSGLSRELPRVIVKGLDTVLFEEDGKEGFLYSETVDTDKLSDYTLDGSPCIVQELLEPKVDVRVTAVGQKMFAAEILRDGSGIKGDWRKGKETLAYEPLDLPQPIQRSLRAYLDHFNLNFGGIDLARVGNEYYFIECNPQGEWAWLSEALHWNLERELADWLVSRACDE